MTVAKEKAEKELGGLKRLQDNQWSIFQPLNIESIAPIAEKKNHRLGPISNVYNGKDSPWEMGHLQEVRCEEKIPLAQ